MHASMHIHKYANILLKTFGHKIYITDLWQHSNELSRRLKLGQVTNIGSWLIQTVKTKYHFILIASWPITPWCYLYPVTCSVHSFATLLWTFAPLRLNSIDFKFKDRKGLNTADERCSSWHDVVNPNTSKYFLFNLSKNGSY